MANSSKDDKSLKNIKNTELEIVFLVLHMTR